jgi:hypothetical protein
MLGTTGVSATGTPSRNLRGIDLSVPSRAVTLPVSFPVPEPDANYALHVDTNWFTDHKVTSKSANGFLVEFSQPAPSRATVDWMLIR